MKIVFSKHNIPIRITDERIDHILNSHPEIEGEENKISETIENPDLILEGDFGEMLAIRLYHKPRCLKTNTWLWHLKK